MINYVSVFIIHSQFTVDFLVVVLTYLTLYYNI